MPKQLSSDAENLLSWINEDSIIEPDDWLIHMKAGNGTFLANAQLTRTFVRAQLVEINEYKPNILPVQIKRDFNLMRIANEADLEPTDEEIKRLKDKLLKLADNSEVKFWMKCLKEDPNYKIDNPIVSAWIIHYQDVIDFINGVDLKAIFRNVAERRRKQDSLTNRFPIG